MTAGIGLMAGLAVPAAAVPFNLQPSVAPPAATPPADARPVVSQRPTRPNVGAASRAKSAVKEGEQDLATRAKGLLTVVVSIDRQQLTLYSNGQPIAHSRVSTGTASHPTPTG